MRMQLKMALSTQCIHTQLHAGRIAERTQLCHKLHTMWHGPRFFHLRQLAQRKAQRHKLDLSPRLFHLQHPAWGGDISAPWTPDAGAAKCTVPWIPQPDAGAAKCSAPWTPQPFARAAKCFTPKGQGRRKGRDGGDGEEYIVEVNI